MRHLRFWPLVGIGFVIAITAIGGFGALFGLVIAAGVALAGLWALTVLLRGFFPWAYRDVHPQAPPEERCPDCGTAMEFVRSLPGFYCWDCGTAVIVRSDGSRVPLRRSTDTQAWQR